MADQPLVPSDAERYRYAAVMAERYDWASLRAERTETPAHRAEREAREIARHRKTLSDPTLRAPGRHAQRGAA